MFVGREQDLHRIDALLDRARDGRGRGLLLRGEAGVGKTTILQQIEPSANGFRIISLCGNDTETGLTYIGLVGLVHGLRDARGELTDRERTILDSVTGTGPPVPVEPLGVGSALLSLFSAVADRSPFLLLVDDLQFVDPTSREVLGFVFRRIANDPIAVVAAVRDSSPITGRDLGFDEVTVTGLGSDETAVLAQSTSPHPVASAVATKIATITGGNPLGVTELARQLTSAQAAGDTPLPSSPAVGSRLVKTFSEGYERLSASGQRVARVVATVGELEPGTLLEVLGDCAAGLDEAEAAGLVTTSNGTLQIRHPLVRTAILAVATPRQRRDAHADVAAGVHGSRRIWHEALAVEGVDAARADALEGAAGDAAARGDRSAAAAAWLRSAEITPDRELRARRLFAAAGMIAGISGDPREIVGRVIELSADQELIADARILTAMVMAWSGEIGSLPAFIAEHEPGIRAIDPFRADVLRGNEFALIWQVGKVGSRDEMLAGKPTIPASGYFDRGILAHVRHASALMVWGDVDEAATQTRAALEETVDGDPMMASPLSFLALATGLSKEGQAHAERMLQAARRIGNGPAAAWLQAFIGDAFLQRGLLLEARRSALEGYELANEGAGPLALSHSAGIVAVACAHLGDAANLSTIAADPRLISAPSLNPRFAVSRAVAKWTQGDLQEAFDELDSEWAALPALGNLATLHGEYVTDRAELAVLLGHPDAAAIVEHARASILSPVLVPGVRRLDLLLAPLDRIDEAFDTVVAAHELADDGPFAKARTDLVYGQRLHAGGREHDARAALARALERFTAAGAEPWCAATLRRLDELGTRTAVHIERDSERLLTPAEERVAQVVANGATTREAASLLFLSPKTIEMHLSRIYRKIGVRNRTELARQYAGRLDAARGLPQSPTAER